MILAAAAAGPGACCSCFRSCSRGAHVSYQSVKHSVIPPNPWLQPTSPLPVWCSWTWAGRATMALTETGLVREAAARGPEPPALPRPPPTASAASVMLRLQALETRRPAEASGFNFRSGVKGFQECVIKSNKFSNPGYRRC